MKQIAHNCNSPCCQCTETQVSSMHKWYIHDGRFSYPHHGEVNTRSWPVSCYLRVLSWTFLQPLTMMWQWCRLYVFTSTKLIFSQSVLQWMFYVYHNQLMNRAISNFHAERVERNSTSGGGKWPWTERKWLCPLHTCSIVCSVLSSTVSISGSSGDFKPWNHTERWCSASREPCKISTRRVKRCSLAIWAKVGFE